MGRFSAIDLPLSSEVGRPNDEHTVRIEDGDANVDEAPSGESLDHKMKTLALRTQELNLGLGGMLGGIPDMARMTIKAAHNTPTNSPRRRKDNDGGVVLARKDAGTPKGRRVWMQFKHSVLKKAAKPHLSYKNWISTLDTARKKEEADRQRVEKLREESANLKKHNGRSGAGRAQFRDEDVSQTEEELLKSMVASKGAIAKKARKKLRKNVNRMVALITPHTPTESAAPDFEIAPEDVALRLYAAAVGQSIVNLQKVRDLLDHFAEEDTLPAVATRDFVAAAMALVHAAPAADVPERAVFAATKDLQLLGGKAGVDLSVVLCWFFGTEPPLNNPSHVRRAYGFRQINSVFDPPHEKLVRVLARNYRILIDDVEAIFVAFVTFDEDESGELDLDELGRLLTVLEGHEPEPSFLHAAMVDLDEDESGTVNFEELFAWHFRGALQGRGDASAEGVFNLLKREKCTYSDLLRVGNVGEVGGVA